LLVFPLTRNNAQDIVIGCEAGYGAFQMESLKSFNDYVVRYLPFETRVIDNYPSYYYYQPSFSIHMKRFEFGIAWSRHSSGSRYSAKDYSGEYLYDTRVNCSGPAALINVCVNPSNKLRILVTNEIGWIKSNLKIKEVLTIDGNDVNIEKLNFSSGDFYWEPGIKIEYPLSVFVFEIHAGYYKQLSKNELQTTVNGEDIPLNYRGEDIPVDWSGYRLGAGIHINFTKFHYL